MPPKKNTAPAESTETTEDTNPPAEVDNTEDTENGGEVNEDEETHSPVDDIDVPTSDDPVIGGIINRILNSAEKIENFKQIVLDNSITQEAITHYARNNTANKELVELRTENEEVEKRIKELRAELDKLSQKNGENIDAMNDIARKALTETIKPSERIKAESDKTKEITRLGDYSRMLRDEVDVDDEKNKGFKEFLTQINSLIYGGQSVIPSGANGGKSSGQSPAKRRRNERVRKWAKEKGIAVNEKGRISKTITDAYAEENPDDLEGLE